MSATTMTAGLNRTASRKGLWRRIGQPFIGAASSGPMRFFLILALAGGVGGVIVGVGMSSDQAPPQSNTAQQARLNPLPGGLQSSPHQDRVALVVNQKEAEQAKAAGSSYTPPMPASQKVSGVGPIAVPPEVPLFIPAPAPAPAVVASAPPRAVVFEAAAAPAAAAPPRETTPVRLIGQANAQTQQQQQAPADDPAFRAAINNLFGGWQGRPGRTTVTLVPGSAWASDGEGDPGRSGEGSSSPGPLARTASSMDPTPVAAASAVARPARSAVERVLVPAGRGIYAHTVLAVNSDSGGPIVLEADTGPVAGARMIGTFSRGSATSERLVVRISSLQFRGQTISVDGLVVAPDTLETSVATSADQHYAARFLLPAAAAFVEGLGQAIATTTNTFSQISPFGGQSFVTRLNPEQQVAVGAGAAAQRVGRELERSAPRGPTIHLAANAAVGVMFLSNVTAPN